MTIFIKYCNKNSDPNRLKILKIVENCISYYPDHRLSSKILLNIVSDFSQYNIDSLNKFFVEMKNSKVNKPTYFDTTTNLQTQQIQNPDLYLGEIEFLQKELNSKNLENFELKRNLNQNAERLIYLQEEIKKLGLISLSKDNEIENLKQTIKAKSALRGGKLMELIMKNNEKYKKMLKESKNLKRLNDNLKQLNKELKGEKEEMNLKFHAAEDTIKNYNEQIENLNYLQGKVDKAQKNFANFKSKLPKDRFHNIDKCRDFDEFIEKYNENFFQYLNDRKYTSKHKNNRVIIQEEKFVTDYKFDTESVFTGCIINQRPEGAGILKFKNGKTLIGEFVKGVLRDNLGIMRESDSSKIYLGSFKNQYSEYELSEGISLVFEKNQHIKLDNVGFGEISNNFLNGKGKCIFPDGGWSNGEYKDGKLEGKGKDWNSHKGFYEGDFKSGQYNGQGKFKKLDGTIYEGGFKNGKYDGSGKKVLPNGETFEGEFKGGQYHGFGKRKTTDGLFFEGYFQNDERNGKGKAVILDGTIMEGQWKHDMKEGLFLITLGNGKKYKAYFKNNKQIVF